VACRTSREKPELVRIVRTPSGEVRPDPGGRAAGRGAYVCQGGDCLSLAIHRGALSRALVTPIPAELRAALLTALVPQIDHQGGARGQE
jgi:predicted RNA-binding protein YlxR (DUF448 family)